MRSPSWHSQSAERDIFDFEEALDAVFRPFAPRTGFLHAAEGRDFGGDDSLVDSDDAVFEAVKHTEDSSHIARVEVAGETILGVVGHANRLGVVLEPEERRN